MSRLFFALLMGTFIFAAPAVSADRLEVGGDAYVSGSSATLSSPAPRDAFVSGFSSYVSERVEKDLGISGFSVGVNAPVGKNAYAAGFSVDISQSIGEDLTAAGFNIHTGPQASVSGNARLAAGNITIDGPISGSLIAVGGNITLNSSIGGDTVLTVNKLAFGSAAKIGGTLIYNAVEPIVIPASVIAPEKVRFEKMTPAATTQSVRETFDKSMPWTGVGIAGIIMVLLMSIAFLVLVAAMLLSFAPEMMERLKNDAISAPIKTMTLGALGLSACIGLVPVSAITLIGIPLIPLAILASFVFWLLGYIVGAYALAMWVVGGFRQVPHSTGGRLLLVTIALLIIAILNSIPFIGWIFNLAVMFLGLGAVTASILRTLLKHTEQAQALPVTVAGNQTAVASKKPRR